MALSERGRETPEDSISRRADSLAMSGRRRPGSCPSVPGGMRPVAGRANLPSVDHTKSWLLTTPARARRTAAFAHAEALQLNTTKYVFFFGTSTRPALRRGSRRMASRSWGRRSRASSISPDLRPDAMADALSEVRNSTESR